MNCFSCDQPAVNACKRCAKTYCDQHGNATYCGECLEPSSAMPSFNLYRGALLVMLVGTAIAVFLLVRPPGETDGSPPVVVGRSTPTVTPAGGTSATQVPEPTSVSNTPPADGTETGGSETPGADVTPPAATPEPTEEPAEATFREYVIVEGDTLYDIATATIAPGDDIAQYVEAIATLNGWTVETADLQPGETMLLPPLPE